MSEVPATDEVMKTYKRADLKEVLESSDFQEMEPNYDQKETLHPRELSAEVIEAVTDKILSLELVKSFKENKRTHFSFRAEIPEIGTLESIGGGESKLSFLLTTQKGKVVVHVAGYDGNLGIQVPTDPKIYMAKGMIGKIRGFYSDLRTYLILPLSIGQEAHYGIMFQEYGRRPAHLASITSRVEELRVRRYVSRYAREKRYPAYEIQEGELRHPRHHFLIKGRVVFIDVEIIFDKN
jgi:hypothetical protein